MILLNVLVNHFAQLECLHERSQQHACVISPPSGVLGEIVAAGPVPALFTALTLKVYVVKGLKLDISAEVV